MTSGRISVVCATEAIGVITREVAAFQRLYPEAHIEVRPGSSREAIGALFGARADLAIITRELMPEERKAAVQGRLEIEGYRYARDALVIVVNNANPVENLGLDDLRRIYDGKLTSWRPLGGTAESTVPIVQPVRSDVSEFFIEEVMKGDPIRAPVVTATSDSDVVRRVMADPRAVGYVTLAGANRGARPLNIAPLTGLSYWKPDAEAVYKGKYPLTRFQNLYLRTDGPPVAKGFVTFVTSSDGQKLVHEEGFVPTSIPVRFVRRSPMLGSHSQGDSIPNHENR